MADPTRHHEFLSLSNRDTFSSEDLRRNPVQPALDTLFSEFARRHRSLSPSTQSSPRIVRNQLRRINQSIHKPSNLDLRSLDYAVEYDSHLMCPICHVPFIEPIVLECDHTFCSSCFNEYRYGTADSERAQCPSCRAVVTSNPRKASRLIYNMCNDIKVKCPNEECSVYMARGYIGRHATRDCPEQNLLCPDSKCDKQTRRKNYIPGHCVHDTRVECDCGMVVELGRGEWLRHKDESCPNTGRKCDQCGERMSMQEHHTLTHVCQSPETQTRCPGAEFGCTEEVLPENFRNHIATCTWARLASHMEKQAQLLSSMQEQLASSKLKNVHLETELERLNDVLAHQVQPQLERLTLSSGINHTPQDDYDGENDIEEIHRDNIPSAAAIHHRDLLLPAHIRDLTPSPDLVSVTDGINHNNQSANNQTHMYNHLLSLHESLRHTVSNLEAEIHSLHHGLAELDARTSMQLINESLRFKEDLTYINATVARDRSQLQWLLNRERIGREQAILRERGRLGSQAQVQQAQVQTSGDVDGQAPNMATPAGSGQRHQNSQHEAFPFPSPGAGMNSTIGGSGSGSGPSSAATSPIFSGVGLVNSGGPTRRPSIRGGSQERVKL